eukprot:13578245-Heterocapsa_arctica.AAC.1
MVVGRCWLPLPLLIGGCGHGASGREASQTVWTQPGIPSGAEVRRGGGDGEKGGEERVRERREWEGTEARRGEGGG